MFFLNRCLFLMFWINMACIYTWWCVPGTATLCIEFKKALVTNSYSKMSYSMFLLTINCRITLLIQFSIELIPFQRSIDIGSPFYLAKNMEFYLFVQGADLPSVYRAGVQGLWGGVHGADQPIEWLQRPRDPGAQVPKAGSDLVVLRYSFFFMWLWTVQNLKSLWAQFLWEIMAAGYCQGAFNFRLFWLFVLLFLICTLCGTWLYKSLYLFVTIHC